MIEKQYVLVLVEKLKRGIKEELINNNAEMALELICNCANILYQTNVYYVDDELESDLKKISDMLALRHPEKTNDNTLLFYDGFGLNDRGLAQIYLNALCQLRAVVYVTYEDRKNTIPDLLKIISEHNGCKAIYIERNRRSLREQIQNLNEVMVSEKPTEFFFYSTPDDVVGSILMNSYDGIIKRYQVNLTDHAFWLGARCIDTCIEFRDYGASVSKKYRLISEDRIVKLPFYPQIHPEREFQGFPFDVKKGQKVVFSGGSLYKTIGGDNKYYEIVDYILSKHDDVIFWYAGSGDDRKLKKILERYPERAHHTDERNDLFQVLKNSRFYLSTYPMCGGLMYQFAASAGKVPVTLKYGDDTDGFLINQRQLGIEFDNLEDLYSEIDRLIADDDYCVSRSKEIKNAVMCEADFRSQLKCILADNKGELLNIEYIDVQTDEFRDEYLTRLDDKDIDSLLVNKKTIKASLKHYPVNAVRGGARKLQGKFIRYFNNSKHI